MISITKLKAIIADNDYSAQDIKDDFNSYPDSWSSALEDVEASFDNMSDKEQDDFKAALFTAADTYAN